MTTFFQIQYVVIHTIHIDVNKTSSWSINMWESHVRDKFIVEENFFKLTYSLFFKINIIIWDSKGDILYRDVMYISIFSLFFLTIK